MFEEFIKFNIHKVIKFWLALYFISFVNVPGASAQNWAPVDSGITGMSPNTTWALCSYDSVMFAGGWFNNAGGIKASDIAQWNGIQWDSTGSGFSNVNVYINALAVYNGNLYVGGAFNSIGEIAANDIAMWNGSTWMPVGTGLKGGDYGVYTMAVYNGILYVGGSFDTAGGKAVFGIAQWNDTNWSALSSTTGIAATDEDDAVLALAVYKGELYIAGDFSSIGGTNIVRWDGSTWSSVGLGATGYIYSLAVYGDNLYVGGMMTMAGTLPVKCIAMWNNSTWSTVDSGIWGENTYAVVTALAVYNGVLYAGGYFDTVKGEAINCIASWNGTKWSPVGSGINIGGAIDAMTVFNGALYVGGGFDSAGGIYAKNIAMWTCPSTIPQLNEIKRIAVYPNPANNILTIETSSINAALPFSIYNELGQQVETGKLNASQNTTFDVSNYASGIYLVSVSDGKQQYCTKFIKN